MTEFDELDDALEKAGALNIAYRRRQRCTVCNLSPAQLTGVHAVIWDVPKGSTTLLPSMRQKTFAANAETALSRRGVKLTRQSITKHVEHVEDTARILGNEKAEYGERKVFATDYRSITDTSARLGMIAARELEGRMNAGTLDDRALVSVLAGGQRARTEEQKLDQRDRQHGDQMKALLLFGSGMLGALPEGEVDEPTVPILVLRAELEAERAGYYLESGAGGGEDDADDG
jgi:hypothetical protein